MDQINGDVRTAELSQLMHDYGESWQIQVDHETGVWTAVERPSPTCLHVIAAHGLTELGEKLRAATRVS